MPLERDESIPTILGSTSLGIGIVFLFLDPFNVIITVFFIEIAFFLLGIAIFINSILSKLNLKFIKFLELTLGLIISIYGIFIFIAIIWGISKKFYILFIFILLSFQIMILGFARMIIAIINRWNQKWFRIWSMIEGFFSCMFSSLMLKFFILDYNILTILIYICAVLGGLSNLLFSISVVLKKEQTNDL